RRNRTLAVAARTAAPVARDVQAFAADAGGLARDHIGQVAARTAGHGPAQGARAGVEVQVAQAGLAHHRGAVGRGRAQAGPERGLRQVAATRVEIVDHLLQGRAPARIQAQVEAGHLGHAADTDALVEAGNGDLVRLVE